MTDTKGESVEIPKNKGESHDLTEAVTESHNWELAGVLISNWNQIIQFLKQIAMLQQAATSRG